EIFRAIIEKIPPPVKKDADQLKALIFDSEFDPYRGAISYIRIIQGEVRSNTKVKFFSTGKIFEVSEIGIFKFKKVAKSSLKAGDVGYLICGAKNVKDTKVGDTITSAEDPAEKQLPGYKEPKPMVFAGLYPAIAEEFEVLRDSISKLKLNDAALFYEPESSKAIGFGFRCGFLGLLHMEIIQERLEREYGLNLVTTVPNVAYKVTTTNNDTFFVESPAKMPDVQKIGKIEEPYISAQIITPTDYIGNIMKLCMERRGTSSGTEYISEKRVILKYRIPLSEIIFDFYDKLKSLSRGYASFDYDHAGFETGDLVKMEILLNGEPVDALSTIIHRDKAHQWGKKLCNKLSEIIPRQLFEVVIQAAIGSKIIARETVKALRKNVTAKCYGGDITRKRKLIERQKEGKKRMKKVGTVEIPQEAFMAILGTGN
ncbi:translation elongation factor 4, partial [candidate division KSB1 bacterium]